MFRECFRGLKDAHADQALSSLFSPLQTVSAPVSDIVIGASFDDSEDDETAKLNRAFVEPQNKKRNSGYKTVSLIELLLPSSKCN